MTGYVKDSQKEDLYIQHFDTAMERRRHIADVTTFMFWKTLPDDV